MLKMLEEALILKLLNVRLFQNILPEFHFYILSFKVCKVYFKSYEM